MDTLNGIVCFVRSAEAGSFAEAARRMGLSAAAVSKNIAKLEQQLGQRLFQRSTRQLRLSEAGERFLAEIGGSLDHLQTAIDNLSGSQAGPAGPLKVSMGLAFGRDYILPLLPAFLARYPLISPDWHFDNRPVELIAEGFDAAIGGGFEMAPGVVARPLAPAHRVLLAAPAYLQAHPPLTEPAALAQHEGILLRAAQTGRIRRWGLRNAQGDEAVIGLRQRMVMGDPEAACRLAAMGLGITLVSTAHALPYLRDGQLSRVLPDWYVDAGTISVYFAAQRLLPQKTRVFVDYLLARCAEERLAERLDAGAAR